MKFSSPARLDLARLLASGSLLCVAVVGVGCAATDWLRQHTPFPQMTKYHPPETSTLLVIEGGFEMLSEDPDPLDVSFVLRDSLGAEWTVDRPLTIAPSVPGSEDREPDTRWGSVALPAGSYTLTEVRFPRGDRACSCAIADGPEVTLDVGSPAYLGWLRLRIRLSPESMDDCRCGDNMYRPLELWFYEEELNAWTDLLRAYPESPWANPIRDRVAELEQ